MSDENNYDHLRLVADNKELQRQREQADQEAKVKAKLERAKGDLARSMKWLAANILRLIVGGGKSYELLDEIVAVVKAYDGMRSLREVYGYAAITPAVEALGRTDSWQRMQSVGEEHFQRWLDDGTVSVARSEDAIIQAALRIVAAEFLGQATQRSTAESAFYDAIDRFNEARRIKYQGGPKVLHEAEARAKPPPPPPAGASDDELMTWYRHHHQAWYGCASEAEAKILIARVVPLLERQTEERRTARAAFEQQFPLNTRVRLKGDGDGRNWSKKKRAAAMKGATGIVAGYQGATARVRWDETGQTFCYGADEIERID